ncbi:MAG: transcriptional regulator, LysR family [Pedosphaera sp.]|nr:transcriptional regulator, LysR family [Pedosphaera sp.]
MDIYHLRSFVVLAEQLHFGRAARILHVSQPALTKQIRRLEADVGGMLFERGKHSTRLSGLGNQILPSARAAIIGFDRVLEEGRQAASGIIGRIRIGIGFHTLELVPSLVMQFRQTSPRVQVFLQDMSTAESVAALAANEIDLGFVRLPAPKHLASCPVLEDSLALVLPADRPFAYGNSIADCRDEAFVMIAKDRSPGFHAHTFALCAKHGFHPRIIQEVREFPTAIAFVRAGMGVTVIPASLQLPHIVGVRIKRLKKPEATWSVGAAWRPADSNPALKAFLGLIRTRPKLSSPV